MEDGPLLVRELLHDKSLLRTPVQGAQTRRRFGPEKSA